MGLEATKYLPIEPTTKAWAIVLGVAVLVLAASDELLLRGRAGPGVRGFVLGATAAGSGIYALLALFYVGLHWCGDPTDNPVCDLSTPTVGLITLGPPALVTAAALFTARRQTPLVFTVATAAAVATSALYAFLPAG